MLDYRNWIKLLFRNRYCWEYIIGPKELFSLQKNCFSHFLRFYLLFFGMLTLFCTSLFSASITFIINAENGLTAVTTCFSYFFVAVQAVVITDKTNNNLDFNCGLVAPGSRGLEWSKFFKMGTQKRTSESSASGLLTNEENYVVRQLLGQRCPSLATTVVQIYKSEGPSHNRYWL